MSPLYVSLQSLWSENSSLTCDVFYFSIWSSNFFILFLFFYSQLDHLWIIETKYVDFTSRDQIICKFNCKWTIRKEKVRNIDVKRWLGKMCSRTFETIRPPTCYLSKTTLVATWDNVLSGNLIAIVFFFLHCFWSLLSFGVVP